MDDSPVEVALNESSSPALHGDYAAVSGPAMVVLGDEAGVSEMVPDVHPAMREIDDVEADAAAEEVEGDDSDDLRSPARKRRRSVRLPPDMSEAQSKPNFAPSDGDDMDKNCCCICLEPWANNGEHRLVCLPCGHLLGDSCAKSCLKIQKKCPICKTKASYKHVRIVYGAPTELRVIDAPELDALKHELKRQKDDFKTLKKKYDALKASKQRLKDQLSRYESRETSARGYVLGSVAGRSGHTQWMFPGLAAASRPVERDGQGAIASLQFAQTLTGPASALAFDAAGSLLFSEAGTAANTVRIRRVPLATPDLIIRSLAFAAPKVNCIGVCSLTGSYRGYIAAGCSDRVIRVLDANLQIATSYSLPAVPVSCTWLSSHPSVVLVGLQNGQLVAFDVSSASTNALKTSCLPAGLPAPPAVHSLVPVSCRGLPDDCVLAASLRCVAVVSFGDTAGFNMHVGRVHGFEGCAAASAFGDIVIMSSRQGTEGSHSIYNSFTRTRSAADADESQLAFGPPVFPNSVSDYSALLPFQRSALLRLRGGGLLVVSNDSHGAKIWKSLSSSSSRAAEWDAQKLEQVEIDGPVRAVSAMVPPWRTGQSPVVAVLCDHKLSLYRIRT
jgi:hypothetical protein